MIKKRFEKTEEAAKLLMKVLVCSKCKQRADELQYLGTVCKHPFCWSCINEFSRTGTNSCPFCHSILELLRPTPALTINSFAEGMDKFFDSLYKYRAAVEREGAPPVVATQKITDNLFSLGEGLRRNVDEFISCTQRPVSGSANSTPSKGTRSRSASESSDDILIKAKKKKSPNENLPPIPEERNKTKQVGFVDYNDFRPVLTSTQKTAYVGTPVTRKPAERPKEETTPQVPMLFMTQELANLRDTKFAEPKTPVIPVPRPTRSFEFTKVPTNVFGREKTNFDKLTLANSPVSPELDVNTPQIKVAREEQPETLERKVPRKSLTYKKKKYELIDAVLDRNLSLAANLLQDGYDVNESDGNQCTALYFAAMYGNLEMCQLLVENGAIINAHCGKTCDTPLHAAVKHERAIVAEYLLDKGANKMVQNLHGKLPIEMGEVDSPVRRMVDRYAGRPVQPKILAKLPEIFIVFMHNIELPVNTLNEFKGFVRCEDNPTIEITHMVIMPDSNSDICEADVVVIQAMLRGLTIVSTRWIIDCVRQKNLIRDTIKYEVNRLRFRDMDIVEGTCKKYRLDKQQLKPRILQGCIFHVVSSRFRTYGSRSFINDIIKQAGGETTSKEPKPSSEDPPPYYRKDLKTPYFILYEPETKLADRILSSPQLHKVSALWLFECLYKHEFVDPY